MKILLAGAALALLQSSATVPFGRYDQCLIFEAPAPASVPPIWGIEFYDVPNYSFLDQPGAYELKGSQVVWTSGILKGQEPGDYDPKAGTVRFRPTTPMGGLPSGARLVCSQKKRG